MLGITLSVVRYAPNSRRRSRYPYELRPPLDTATKGDKGEMYAVWASKAVVDKFMIKIREKVETGAW